MKYFLPLLALFLCIQCNTKTKKQSDVEENTEDTTEIATDTVMSVEPDGGIGDGATSIENLFVSSIENAHHKNDFLKQNAIQFDLKLFFGGKQRLDGTITMLTNSSKIIVNKKDGSQLLFDGDKVYLSPKDADDKGARFAMFTWPYFFGLPYKLSDPGTNWAMEEDMKLDEETYATAKLTFDKGVGDAPDDWYLVYKDPATQLIQAAVYIVTFGSEGDISKAEADPHAIVYNNYEETSGIPIATEWKFYGWNPEKGLTKELGNASISNIKFLDKTESMFTIPENSKTIPLQ